MRQNTILIQNHNPWIDPLLLLDETKNNGSWYKGDIYSFGITALQLTYGQTPNIPMNKNKIFLKGQFQNVGIQSYDKKCPFGKNFESLIQCCCSLQPDERQSVNQLIEHPFF